MELFTQLFGRLLLFVYHCFDRIVIHGYLSGLSRPEQVVHFFRQILGVPILSKEVLAQRTNDYQNWVEAFARNHHIPIEWGQKGVRKEDQVLPWLRRIRKKGAYGVYFIFKRLERGRFSWPSAGDELDRVMLSHEELSLLLGGIELTRTRRKNWYRKESALSEKM